MEFIGKRSHKKAVREWGCVRSIGRTTRSQERRHFFAASAASQLSNLHIETFNQEKGEFSSLKKSDSFYRDYMKAVWIWHMKAVLRDEYVDAWYLF